MPLIAHAHEILTHDDPWMSQGVGFSFGGMRGVPVSTLVPDFEWSALQAASRHVCGRQHLPSMCHPCGAGGRPTRAREPLLLLNRFCCTHLPLCHAGMTQSCCLGTSSCRAPPALCTVLVDCQTLNHPPQSRPLTGCAFSGAHILGKKRQQMLY